MQPSHYCGRATLRINSFIQYALFDSGLLASHTGGMLLSSTEWYIGIAERLARPFLKGCDLTRVTHCFADPISTQTFAILYGNEDADDLDRLYTDPTFKLGCGRCPTPAATYTRSRAYRCWGNAQRLRSVIPHIYFLINA